MFIAGTLAGCGGGEKASSNSDFDDQISKAEKISDSADEGPKPGGRSEGPCQGEPQRRCEKSRQQGGRRNRQD
jgi:hypothetical protein